MPGKNVINLSRIDVAINTSEAADLPVLLAVFEARFLLNQVNHAAALEDQRRTWASHINRLSANIIDGPDPGEANDAFAQEMLEMVVPFLEGQPGDRCQYCGKYTCGCVSQAG